VALKFGRTRYRLRTGTVTRLAPRKRRLIDAQLRFFGLMLGPAEVGDERLAGILALGPTEHLVAIPTTAGRLALAIESEAELIDALGGALSDRSGRGQDHHHTDQQTGEQDQVHQVPHE
jgi:hypothetical protein